MITSTISGQTKTFSLHEMSDVLMSRTTVPVGLFVSAQLWEHLKARLRHEGNELGFDDKPKDLFGLKVAIDHRLPATDFEVAYTEKAWSNRLKELSRATAQPTPAVME